MSQRESQTNEPIKTKEDLEQAFDGAYQPHLEIKRGEEGENETTFRGYNIAADPVIFTEFVIRAQAAGWKVGNVTQIGQIMSVALEKPAE